MIVATDGTPLGRFVGVTRCQRCGRSLAHWEIDAVPSLRWSALDSSPDPGPARPMAVTDLEVTHQGRYAPHNCGPQGVLL